MGSANDRELETFYGVIAPYYDQDYAGLLEGADIAFYRRMAEQSGGPALEMGCGTGRVLLPVARAGIAAFGIDASEAMLDRFQALLAAEPAEVRGRVSIIRGDMRSTDLGRRFPLVFSAGNVPHSFLERRDQRAWLANARRHLAPGGSLCFDVFQPDFRRLMAEPEWVIDAERIHPETGIRVKRFSRCHHEVEMQRFRVEMRWVTEDAAGRTVSEESGSVMQRWFTRGELEALLELEGLAVADYWGGFAGEPFGPGSRTQVVRAVAAV